MEPPEPLVFISYSWTSAKHQEMVKEVADRLLSDGVGVILDIYDLKEGDDKNAFMEQMVTRPDVSHVLLMSDKSYSQKADGRIRGVGTESQIISQEVYEKTVQSKFIPLVWEFNPDESPCLPTFMKSRIWIDFSSPEMVNKNWEKLIRLLFGKPLHQKPAKAAEPAYLRESSLPTTAISGKYQMLRQAIFNSAPSIAVLRSEFLDACFSYADALRVRTAPDLETLGQRVLEDCGKLIPVRDHLVDWILLESSMGQSSRLEDEITNVLERLSDLASRPPEVNQWNEGWFDAHRIFTYETFIYIVAALLKAEAFKILNHIFTTHYLRPSSARYGDTGFDRFDGFYTSSRTLGQVMNTAERRLLSPTAELVKRQANRSDITFNALMQGDLLIFLNSLLSADTRWYPQLLIYADYAPDFPFFIRTARKKDFKKLAEILGESDVEKLKEQIRDGYQSSGVASWNDFRFHGDFFQAMNLLKWNSLD